MLLAFLCATPVLAVDQPDSAPSVSEVHGNFYLLEENDVLIYGLYDFPYGTIPDDDAGDAYVIRLLDTDNATLLGSYLPFPYFDSGYNEGVFALYFSATDNLTVDQAYIIRISQNPAFFDDPQSFDFVMQLTAWTDAATQDDNRAELTLNIIEIARELEDAHDETLIESSVGGTVLSDPTGETYFRQAIYGIQAMAPDLFLVQTLTWDTDARDWDIIGDDGSVTTQFDEYTGRFTGTFIETATENISGTLGLGDTDGTGGTSTLMTLLYAIPIIIGTAIVSNIKWRKTDPALIVAPVVLILVALMGWINAALFATIFQIMAIYIGYLWFYSRAGDNLGGKFFSFLGFIWIASVLICLAVEGSWLGSTENTIINDLSAFNAIKIGGLASIPTSSVYFFRGVFRLLIWDYSFYTGNFVFLRYIYLVIFTGSAIYCMTRDFAPVIANFMRSVIGVLRGGV